MSGVTGRRTVLLGSALAALAACSKLEDPPGGAGPSSASASPSASTPPSTAGSSPVATPSPSGGDPRALAESMPLEARVGQLIMMGHSTSQLDGRTRERIEEHQLGSLLLLGNTLGGRPDLAAFSSQLSGLELPSPIMIAADQEGGQIQRLSGSGFSTIPSAVDQGQQSPATLQQNWATWGGELARVGVHYNLAPVADLVPPDNVSRNAPIGQLKRHFGTDVEVIGAHVEAAIKGMSQAKVAGSVKHFPGLGRVGTNTDFGSATDSVTTADDPGLATFRRAIAAGVASVMVSSAIYTRIDPDHQAVFSAKVITEMLRGSLGFDKVVISDDLGAAASVSSVPAGERATRFLQAGGDVVITADPQLVRPMAQAILDLAGNDQAFADEITTKATRVLQLKASFA